MASARLKGRAGPARSAPILASLIGVLVLLLSLVWNAVASDRVRAEAERARLHGVEVIVDAQRALSALQSAETGQRGFLLTGDSEYLDFYYAGMVEVGRHLHELDEMTSGDPVQNGRILALSRLAQRRVALLDQTVQLWQAERQAEALAIINTNEGREAMIRARALIASLIGEEERTLARRGDAADRAEARARWAL
ncbi:CHASE3 domain-containing protein [Rubellimicrobium roseum]|uniref:CHASE3 domain-containing protein n=1 Tax=Rubellimicrobium roseum TaxID=687525 RepID=A0A5C4NH52_9RHOB|nr:CHASE3 domain-containing protein [Rubellimicrobium roseum]TNC72017.1 hypothetical protein FHG71_09800 [Rubellimicrobium roseum]